MIDTLSPYRPGLTAIAAVLALSSTSAIAQLALPDIGPSAAPPVAAPVAQAAPVQTIQSVPVTPKLPDIAVADAPARAEPVRPQAAPRQQAAQQVTAPAAERQAAAPRAAAATAPVAEAAAPMAAAPVLQADTAARPRDRAPASEQTMAEQSRAEATASDDMGYAGWALLGGGLLIVAGGAAFAMSRRPKRREMEAGREMETGHADYVVPVTPVVPEATAPQPAARTEALVAAPVAREEPRRHRAAVQGQSMGNGPSDDRRALLEAMVAEAPTQANPFHSRRNRMRRADFLLRTGQADDRAKAPERRIADEPALATDRWSETRFGGKQNTRISWKPAPTR